MIGILIPVHNEEALLAECLDAALVAASHPDLHGEAVQILVVLDSCSDASAVIASAYPVQCLDVQARNVGHARGVGARHLLNAGARWIACTDADSRVSPDWLVAQLALEADVVCGTVTVDAWSEDFDTPAQIRYHQGYAARDGHRHIHGANLGVSAAAYIRAGGFEPLACHEDVQLVRDLERCGASIAWSHRPQVVTSARLQARAQGGFGDFLKSLVCAT
ncbi:glycosyl transferase [Pseudomonas fluorescens]|uniref:Glycosyltransferase family 2 protein n=1 Tax=Pseudomonas lactucae TaxID=2813360 RepID=A0A9X1C5P5_9PSED|nr:glycosyltransferase family 2 protein [Pseudomonas lactucae]OPA90242.1 glycosyl transferase [Pseudomonas fluorescens]MBN2975982.1 glycosyltransferase family 2 protein [Pseudomonas lactucae]MBN2988856.1 glycosyltransferase family 2 protein [Pseudomonas lactucae]OPB09511.1 glycosyl transferase [Pseudomonas fluorescens]OPB21356.1 glycosyl transferase [Pseudomonas fluorescens]